MKKNLFFMLLACSVCLLASCQGEPGRDGRNGRDGRDGRDCEMKTVLIDVPVKSWQYSDIDNNNYFYATVDMPEITEPIFKNGLIKMYRVYDFDTNNAAQVEMPFTRLKEFQNSKGEWAFYSEVVDYEFGLGRMTIYYTVSDFDYELDLAFVPEAMKFRCVIAY